MHQLNEDENWNWRKMGILFQFGALFTDMSAFDNVGSRMREHTNLPEEMIRDLVLMKLRSQIARRQPADAFGTVRRYGAPGCWHAPSPLIRC